MPFFDQYPYTNFHNINLDWILERVKEWGQMVEDNNTRFENLEQANEDFKTYVTNYLENLNIQTAIDDKLNRMFESGELTDYLQPYVSTTVTTWLDENITEPTGVVIDSSLTVAGACADAKTVGDKLDLLGFSTDGKIALLNVLEELAYTSQNAKILYNELEMYLLEYALYNKYNWTLTSSELIALHCTGTAGHPENESGNIWLNTSNPTAGNMDKRRRSIVIKRGRKPFIDYYTRQDTIYYPIPVPKDATGYKIYGNYNTFYIGVEGCILDRIHNNYIPVPDGYNISNGYQEGIIDKSFINSVPDNTFIYIVLKANNAGDGIFDENQPAEFTVEFKRG